MKGSKGFTLIELMVVIAILGVLAASAFPTYRTFRRRAVGAEATTIMKQLINAEIMYYLENSHNKYFLGSRGVIEVYHDGKGHSASDAQEVKDALNVTLPTGHFLDFQIMDFGGGSIIIIISAKFPIFRDGSKHIQSTISEEGSVDTLVY